MIYPQEISSDMDLGRRILVRARSIAPGLNDIPDGDERRLEAIAILKNVVAEVPAPGARRVAARSRNGAAITYRDIRGAFSDDDKLSLRELVDVTPRGLPAGSFPEPGAISRVWREERYR